MDSTDTAVDQHDADSITEFFVRVARCIASNAEYFMATRGVLTFDIRSRCTWTLRFGDPRTPLEANDEVQPDMRLRFSPQAFDGYAQGDLDVQRAVADKELEILGDTRVLEQFRQLMQPANSLTIRRY